MNTVDKKGDEMRGSVLLDAFTYPKIIPSDRHSTIVMFSNKRTFEETDIENQRETFFEFVKAGDKSEAKDLLFAHVTVNGGFNSMLSGRVGCVDGAVKPCVVIYSKGSSTPILFEGGRRGLITTSSLRKFAAKHSNYFFPGAHAIKSMGEHVEAFNAAGLKEDRDVIILAASKVVEEMAEGSAKDTSNYYLKVMGKIQEKGFEWADMESSRLTGILDSGQVTVRASIRKLQMKLQITEEFDKAFNMDPTKEVHLTEDEMKENAAEAAAAGVKSEL
jgi:hypothetical protein